MFPSGGRHVLFIYHVYIFQVVQHQFCRHFLPPHLYRGSILNIYTECTLNLSLCWPRNVSILFYIFYNLRVEGDSRVWRFRMSWVTLKHCRRFKACSEEPASAVFSASRAIPPTDSILIPPQSAPRYHRVQAALRGNVCSSKARTSNPSLLCLNKQIEFTAFII